MAPTRVRRVPEEKGGHEPTRPWPRVKAETKPQGVTSQGTARSGLFCLARGGLCVTYVAASQTVASQTVALISKLLNHSNSEKAKKLRTITTVNQWINASLNLGQYAIVTTPQLIPNCVLSRYNKYITDYSDEMKANDAKKSKQVLTLYVKHDELLRFSWGNTLSPRTICMTTRVHR